MNIKKKLSVSFAAVMIAMLFISVSLFSELKSVDEGYEVIVNQNVPVEKYISEIRGMNLEQVAAVRAYILYRDENFPPLFESISTELETVYSKVEANAQTETSRKSLAKVKEINVQYSNIAREVFALVKSGDIESAISRAADGREQVTALKNVTDEWLKFVEEVDQEIIEEINTSVDHAIRNVLIGAGIAIVLVAGLVNFLVNSITKPVHEIVNHANIIATGDLSHEISQNLLKKKDETGELATAFDRMSKTLRELISTVAQSSEQVAASSEELTATSQELATASEEVAKTIEEIAKSATEQSKDTDDGVMAAMKLGEYIESNKSYLDDVNSGSNQVAALIGEGLETVKILTQKTIESRNASMDVYEGIKKTNKSSERIGQASNVIASISGQTNLLALNAAIEAARAGEAGKGFAVVAEEIRKLAEQSSESTKEIDAVVKELQFNSKNVVEIMDKASEIIKEQGKSVETVKEKFEEISNSINSTGDKLILLNESEKAVEERKDEIIGIIQNLSAIAEENSACTEEAAASTEQQIASMADIANSSEGLAEIAQEVQQAISKFKI